MVMAMQGHAQGISINSTGAAPHSSAMLDVSGTNSGMLIPRVNLATAVFPAPGPATHLIVINTNASYSMGIGAYRNAGTPAAPNWVKWLEPVDAWGTRGNAGTNASTNFIGTTDGTDLSIRANSTEKILVPRNTGASNGTMFFRNFTVADFSSIQSIRVPNNNGSGALSIRFFSATGNGGLFGFGVSGVGIKAGTTGGVYNNGMVTSFSDNGVRIQQGTITIPDEPENSRLDVDGNILTRGKIGYNEYANGAQKTFLNEIHWNGVIGSGADSPQLLTEGMNLTIVVRRTAGNAYYLRVATRLPRVFTCIDQDSKEIVSVNTPGPNLAAANRVPVNFTNDIVGADGLRTIFIKEPARPEVTYQVTLLVLNNVTTVMIKRFES